MKKIFTLKGIAITITLSIIIIVSGTVICSHVLHNEMAELGAEGYYIKAPINEPEWLIVNRKNKKMGCIYPLQEYFYRH